MTRLLLAFLIALWAAAPAAAQAPISTLSENVPIAAHGAWVAWSEPVGDEYRLVAARDGERVVPPVPLRSEPFDLDLGTDRRGRTVATYTRCTDRCGMYVLHLHTGVERRPDVPGRRGTHPSMWRGRLAFARLAPGRHPVDRVLVWSGGERLREYPHGPVDRCDRGGPCSRRTIYGRVSAIDLGARFVAFRWDMWGPHVYGHQVSQIRADRLPDGRRFHLGSGLLGEVCTGGIDTVLLSAPSVIRRAVWFGRRTASCYHFDSTVLRAVARRPFTGRIGDFDGDLLQFVRTRSAAYGLVTTTPSGENVVDCADPNPCELRRLGLPPLDRDAPEPRSPFF